LLIKNKSFFYIFTAIFADAISGLFYKKKKFTIALLSEVFVPDQDILVCPMQLRREEVSRLRALADNEQALVAVARFHIALQMLGSVVKWLSAIIGLLVLLKGFAGL
jgi:hypothetical protein